MPARASRRLVIDASVARAAGGEGATHPASKHCRDFLQAVLDICHRVVMTQDIMSEWNTHQSSFARRWRVAMTSRKKVYRVDAAVDRGLQSRIEPHAPTAQIREIMRKDLLLIAAALRTDKIVISCDTRARTHFATASGIIGELSNIVWINPGIVGEAAIVWLQKGAKSEKTHHLGFTVSARRGRARER